VVAYDAFFNRNNYNQITGIYESVGITFEIRKIGGICLRRSSRRLVLDQSGEQENEAHVTGRLTALRLMAWQQWPVTGIW